LPARHFRSFATLSAPLATKKIERRFQFSPEGAEELSAFHERTMDSLRIAFSVFMSGDVGEARKLLAEKALLRSVELAATERHLDRLREGRPESIETTSLHLDVLRDLSRIHSHICSVAYPVLDAAGEFAERLSAESGPIELPSTTTHPGVYRMWGALDRMSRNVCSWGRFDMPGNQPRLPNLAYFVAKVFLGRRTENFPGR